MFHAFPYTDYHELNLDWLIGQNGQCGFRLEVQGDYLRLINARSEVVSQVKIHYADLALKDVDGRDIQTYIFSAGTAGDQLVFTHGDNTVTSITIPFATKAAEDVQGKDILDYAYNLSISGDKLRIVKGDGNAVELTIPFSVKASQDEFGKAIDTYAASLEVSGNTLILRDSKGRQLNQITVPYATNAGTADEANHASTADEALEAGHADTADLATEADLATNAYNAVQTVTVSGDNMLFTTYGGQVFTIQAPYSVKAQKDDNGNNIKTTYVANVSLDENTGEISFFDGVGNVIATLTPTASVATRDTYGNLIADYIKSIVVTQDSDYITVTHGTGTVDSIQIDYSRRAWKDTNNNVIKNTYVTTLECVEDVDDGHYKLVWYNGDTPIAEIGRCEIWAYKAQVDINNKDLTSYVANVAVDGSDSTKVKVIDGSNNVLNTINGTVTSTPAGTVSASASGTAVTLTSGTLPSASYDSVTQTLTFDFGAFPTVDTVTDPTVAATFSGTQSTENVDFND